jgi:hypothetical protein
MNKTGVVSLLASPHIWRVGDLPRGERSGIPTGLGALDAELPEGGWPQQGMTELLCDQMGAGEVSLLMPALAATIRESRSVAWINPPCLPYAPALANAGLDLSQLMIVRAESLAENLWAAEQALRSGALGVVLLWLKQHVDYASLRRLHLAAESGNCAAFVYRSTGFAVQPSPAPLRVHVEMENNASVITILKRRGMMTSRRIPLASASMPTPILRSAKPTQRPSAGPDLRATAKPAARTLSLVAG